MPARKVSRRAYRNHLLFRGASESTVQCYEKWVLRGTKRVRAFAEVLSRRGSLETKVKAYNAKIIEAYSQNTRIQVAAACNHYLELLDAKDSKEKALRLPVPKKDHKRDMPWFKDVRDLDRFLKTAKKMGPRFEFLALLLRDTGWNSSMIAALKPQHFQTETLSDGRPVGVFDLGQRQKTGARTKATVRPETAAAFLEYVKRSNPGTYVFERPSGVPVNRRDVLAMVRRIAKRAGLPHGKGGVSPRWFRRTLATRWPGTDPALMLQAGWSDSRTMKETYAQEDLELTQEALEEMFRRRKRQDPEENIDIAYA